MTQESLQAMSVEQLRDHARKNTNLKKTAIVFMKKADLIQAILNPETLEQIPANTANKQQQDGQSIDLAAAIANALQGRLHAGLDESRVKEIICDALLPLEENLTEKFLRKTALDLPALLDLVKKMIDDATKDNVKTIQVVNTETQERKDLGIQHFLFETALTVIQGGCNLMLVGPAGSGKTHMVHAIADALSIRFIPQSVTSQTSLSSLMGYMSASGAYVSSPFRDAYENGGLYLLDEIDAGNANVISALNAATSNGCCLFPDNTLIEKHANFRIAAGANTYGRGANRQYAGRNPIDGATLDRFVVLDMPYDEALENALATNRDWCREVQNIRKAVDSMPDIKHIVSPRATFAGSKLLAMGIDRETVREMTIWKGLNAETKARIVAQAGV